MERHWLPYEVWKNILLLVDYVARARVQLVCKGWNKMYWGYITFLNWSHREFKNKESKKLLRSVDANIIRSLDLSFSTFKTDDIANFTLLHSLVNLRMAEVDFCQMDLNARSLELLSRFGSLRSLEIPVSSGVPALGARFLLALTQLSTLDVSGWKINREDIKTISKMSSLKRLTMKSCEVNGGLKLLCSGPNSQLEYLDVREISITEPQEDPTSISTLTPLFELRTGGITGINYHFTSMRSLTNLMALDYRSPINNEAINTITSLRRLVSLSLSDCSDISEDEISKLFQNVGIQYLCLSEANLSNSDNIINLSNLTTLTLTNSIIPSEFFTYTSKLCHLQINTCNLTNDHHIHLATLVHLQTLLLKGDYLFQEEVNFDCLSKLTNLSSLTMKNLHCEDLKFLECLSNLKKFELVKMHLSNTSLMSIEKLTNLESLHLTSLSGTDLSILKKLTKLQELTLAACGKLLDFIKILKVLPRLESLDVSKMYLSSSDQLLLAHSLPNVMISWTKRS